MIVCGFSETRSFIGRLDPGKDVIASFSTFCLENSVTCGWIWAVCLLKDPRVMPVGPQGFGEEQVLRGHHYCGSLVGNVSMLEGSTHVRLYGSLVPLDTGETAMGIVAGGEVVFCEFAFLVMEGLVPVREGELGEGFNLWVQLAPKADREVSPIKGPVPQRPPRAPLYESEDYDETTELMVLEMKPGDYLDHPRLGLCRIVAEPQEDRISVRLKTGRCVDLHIAALRVMPPKEQDGKRIFRVTLKKKP